jgi:hypothetical protein
VLSQYYSRPERSQVKAVPVLAFAAVNAVKYGAVVIYVIPPALKFVASPPVWFGILPVALEYSKVMVAAVAAVKAMVALSSKLYKVILPVILKPSIAQSRQVFMLAVLPPTITPPFCVMF